MSQVEVPLTLAAIIARLPLNTEASTFALPTGWVYSPQHGYFPTGSAPAGSRDIYRALTNRHDRVELEQHLEAALTEESSASSDPLSAGVSCAAAAVDAVLAPSWGGGVGASGFGDDAGGGEAAGSGSAEATKELTPWVGAVVRGEWQIRNKYVGTVVRWILQVREPCSPACGLPPR